MTSGSQRTFLLGVCASLVVALAPGRAVAADDVRIREVSVDRFPRVDVIVSAGDELETTDVSIEEAGRAIPNAAVKPLNKSGQIVDVVLVIDTSGSMQGEPMTAALSAASSFVEEVPDNVRVGVVSFADEARRVSGFGARAEQTTEAITSLVASGETAMFDGVRTATKMFEGDNQRNIVLLSDGGDTASSSNLRVASDSAQRAEAAIFAVGLKTTETDIEALKTLSSTTGGRYQPAGAADLSSVYGAIATELASQFAISFESQAGSGDDIAIRVIAPSGTDEVTVLAPQGIAKVASDPVATPAEVPAALPGWFLPLVLVLCFAAVFWLGLWFIGSRARDQRESLLRRALNEPLPRMDEDVDGDDESSASWLPDVFVAAGGRVATGAGFRKKLDLRLERGSVTLRPDEFVGISLVAGIIGYLVGIILSTALLGIVVAAIGLTAPSLWLRVVTNRRMTKLNDQIPDILNVLAGSLRAGHSFLQALDMVAREVDDPGASEFQRAVAEIRLGRTVTEALEAMSERIGSEGFSWAILAVNIQREVGGNLAELLDTVSDTLRTRDALKRQVQTLSAEGRMSMYVLAALPVGIGAYVAVVNPDYIALLFNTNTGRVMLMSGVGLLAAGFLWMRKVVSIDV